MSVNRNQYFSKIILGILSTRITTLSVLKRRLLLNQQS